jgi:predicted RNA-binding protein (virulence factor B family)
MDQSPKPKYDIGQKVNLEIQRETDLGFVALVNSVDEGLLYHSEVFEILDPGQNLPGYVKKIREDGKLDLILQPFGNLGSNDLGQEILQILKEHNGFLPVTDKTPPEKIYELFRVSKKKFKMALGALYKKRCIAINEEGIRLIPSSQKLK